MKKKSGVDYGLIFILFLVEIGGAITLDEFAENYLLKLLSDFEKAPNKDEYDNIISPPLISFDSTEGAWKLLPFVFIWSPSEHFGLSLHCPSHHEQLELGPSTDNLTKQGDKRNPRLVYRVGGNVILVQRFLICPFRHRFLSAQDDIMTLLPDYASKGAFPFELHHKSGFDKDVTAFVKSNILAGASFQQICESIAYLNYESFTKRIRYCHLKNSAVINSAEGQRTGEIPEFTEDDVLFSFPSSDKLIDLFLGDYKQSELHYQNAVANKNTSFCLSTDHTFKVGKNIGCFNQDGQFVNQFGKLFIVLNEAREVVGWRLTKTTRHEEIKDLLETIKSRIAVDLTYVIVDDCCKEQKLYQSVFGEKTKVKLDLFHAVQRVVREIPDKGDLHSLKLVREFGLIFREDNDQGEKRTLATPSPAKIKTNMQLLKERHASYI